MKSILRRLTRPIVLAAVVLLSVIDGSLHDASAAEPTANGSSEITRQQYPLMRSGVAPEGRSVAAVDLGIENYRSLVLPILNTYCGKCHGPEKQNGKIRFDTAPDTGDSVDSLSFWQDTLDLLNGGDMPPKDEKQLSTEELTDVLGAVSRAVSKARTYLASQDVVTPMRRLNKREYINTIEDLLGVEITGSGLPDDDAFEGFDTTAENLSLSPMQWERYYEIGLDVVSGIMAENQYEEMPPSEVATIEAEDVRQRDIVAIQEGKREEYERYLEMAKVLENEYDGDAEEFVKHYINHKGEKFTSAKGFKKHLENRRKRGLPGPQDTYLEDYPHTDSGAILGVKKRFPFASIQVEIPQLVVAANAVHNDRVRMKVTCADMGSGGGGPSFLKVTQGSKTFGGVIGMFPVDGSVEDPQEIEFEFDVEASGETEERLASRLIFSVVQAGKPSGIPMVWLDRIEAVGPIYDEWPTRGYRALFGEGGLAAIDDAESARELLRDFADRAFRSQSPSDAFLDRLVRRYREDRKRGLASSEALKPALASILVAPEFLYLVENRSTEERQWVSDIELANRLSYFLWSSMPDEQLLELASAGELHKRKVLRKQVDRMVRDPKFERFARSFSHQWLELDRLNDIQIAVKAFPKYSDDVKSSSYAETYAFFANLFRNDQSVLDVIKSDYAVVDRVMAAFYELPQPDGVGFQKVRLPAGSRRGGFLTQSSFLTMTTNGDRTSPVDRGAFVLRKFLDEPKMSPPPNVPQLPVQEGTKKKGKKGKKDESTEPQPSIRELMTEHNTRAQCAFCHRNIDPLGFALESYDAIGQWREYEGDSNEPIDTSGTMPGGKRSFADFEGMQSLLLEDRQLFVRSLVKAVMRYGVGREISFQDDDLVDQIVEFVTLNDYSARSVLHAIVMSEAFQIK